jgi:hypothetical protein|tara:strand:- start:16413 stop:17060 length:648 start_codon:yes stop_codon:yes gene_type:complete
MRFLPIFLIITSCGFFESKQTEGGSLFLAAKEAGYLKDGIVKSDIEKISKKIISAKYVESLMVGRVSVSVSEVAEYYEKNKNQYKRVSDEALVLVFERQNKNSAIKIKSVLERNNFDSERVSKTIQENTPRRIFVEKKDLKPSLGEKIFVKKGYSFITQRDNGFVVFYTINIFKKDSLRELADVSDNIQARMLALKKHTLKEEIKDSLYTIYGYD